MFSKERFFSALKPHLKHSQILLKPRDCKQYAQGIRVGGGPVLTVLKPQSLIALWRVLQVCVEHDVIIIMQASNTGVTAGSTPYGNDYDRPVVIISTLALDKIVLLNNGEQVLAYAGATLYSLENKLEAIEREPHSVIGSSCIGASIVGGVCNNSGGSLVNRGPAYTELALYAQLDSSGELRLVNELGIDSAAVLQGADSQSPESILAFLDQQHSELSLAQRSSKKASDVDYQQRIRDISADSPARYNADPRRLHQASGCAGKLAVFAVRLDTFTKPTKSQVFYIGTSEPQNFNSIRRRVLKDFVSLPELGEYMHASYFDASDRYCKDIFLIIKRFGSERLTRLWSLNEKVNQIFDRLKIFPDRVAERVLLAFSHWLPDHLPVRVRQFRKRFDHHLIVKATDENIAEMEDLLKSIKSEARGDKNSRSNELFDYFQCDEKEAEDVLLHRFVAGNGVTRYALLNAQDVSGIAPLDIALRRNDEEWMDLPPKSVATKLATPLILSHFFCNVFHLDLVVKKDYAVEEVKQEFLNYLDRRGAKYPAEHNVGHYYSAEPAHQSFYRELDPCNSFNAGVGKMSKNKYYR